MVLQTFNPPIPPSTGTDIVPKVKVLQADFGDGYRQRAADGLNHIVRHYTFVWEFIAATEADTIDGFLTACGGVKAFLYTPPGEAVARRFICQSWGRKRVRNAFHQIKADFQEVFDL